MIVHFNIHMDPTKGKVDQTEILDIIQNEINIKDLPSYEGEETSSIFGDIVIDDNSIQVQGIFRHFPRR